jgi:FixJ family two-component response regulator
MTEAYGWIAIVDDDPFVLRALTRLLCAHDFPARPYSSARQFLAALSAGLPACLIVDLQMPDVGGLELLHHLKRESIRIPTIVATAHDDGAVRGRCISAGAAGFLVKPVQARSLLAAIADASGLAVLS